MAEGIKNEDQETEKAEEKVANAVWRIENKDAADSITGSKWVDTGKNFLKTSGKVAGFGASMFMNLVVGSIYYIYKAAEKIIQKGGKVSFSDMYGIFKKGKKEK